MDCKGLEGDELKKCQEKNKRPNQQKDENRYTDGDAKVQVYSGFYSSFEFDLDGNFKKLVCAE